MHTRTFHSWHTTPTVLAFLVEVAATGQEEEGTERKDTLLVAEIEGFRNTVNRFLNKMDIFAIMD